MSEFAQLPLKTANGAPLVHKYRRHAEEAAGLLIVFPGNRYGVDGPLLYYPSSLLWRSGWDVLAVTYGFQSAMAEVTPEVFPQTMRECRSAVQEALLARSYSRVGLLGKSLGANVVAYLCGALPKLEGSRAAYLTPPIGTGWFDSAYASTRQPSYVALGTADGFYDAEALRQLREVRPCELTVIEGGDHSLEIEGDLERSLEALGKVCREVAAFLQG